MINIKYHYTLDFLNKIKSNIGDISALNSRERLSENERHFYWLSINTNLLLIKVTLSGLDKSSLIRFDERKYWYTSLEAYYRLGFVHKSVWIIYTKFSNLDIIQDTFVPHHKMLKNNQNIGKETRGVFLKTFPWLPFMVSRRSMCSHFCSLIWVKMVSNEIKHINLTEDDHSSNNIDYRFKST